MQAPELAVKELIRCKKELGKNVKHNFRTVKAFNSKILLLSDMSIISRR
jgi:hypothetical protein